MEYSEKAYQQLLKMRANGKKNYDEWCYSQSLDDLREANNALKEAIDAYYRDPTVANEAEKIVTWRREIMEGKRSDPKMTDTMYELRGYKMKEECDKYYAEWTQRVIGPKGYWTPGMTR
jgi:hypothetical protein